MKLRALEKKVEEYIEFYVKNLLLQIKVVQ